jgi:ubiquinone biosynthesis protein UbiJ
VSPRLVQRATGLLNQLIDATPGAAGHLARHPGQSLRLVLAGQQLDVQVDQDGHFQPAELALADAEIRLDAALLARLPIEGRSVLKRAEVRGDGEWLNALDQLFSQLHPEPAALLAPHIGELAAEHLAQTLSQSHTQLKHSAQSAGETLADYLGEESGLLAPPLAARDFIGEVDRLRDDTARFEARLALLERRLREHT